MLVTGHQRGLPLTAQVGHIMGLGDRHCENIMIDAASGDCVHIDFGIMFDKVWRAACPEGS